MLSGSDVIFSDGDAIWLKDPTPYISKLNLMSPQLIASRAWYPQRLFKKWGASICMGFIYFNAGPFTIDFTNTMIEDLHLQMKVNDTKPDDQVAANYILEQWNISWPRKMVVGANSIPDVGIVNRNSSDYKIVLLPHSQFMRKCHSMTSREILIAIDNATVVHCRLPTGSGSKKESKMKALSLWRLVDNWKYKLLLEYQRNKTEEIPWNKSILLIASGIDKSGKLKPFDRLIERQYKYHSSLKKENGEIKKGANKEMLKGRLEKYKNKTKSAKIKAKQSTDKQKLPKKANKITNEDTNLKDKGYYDDDYSKKQTLDLTQGILLDDLIQYLDENVTDNIIHNNDTHIGLIE
jgi:hypothetical protein